VTSLLDVFVTVKPDMDKFGPEVKKKLALIDSKADGAKVAGRFGVGFNGAFGGIVKHSAGLFVGAFAAIKGAQFLGGFINDARESAKVARISAQVIKSTGGVAGITAAQIGDLATAISNKTGADDEAIQSGENLLATFTNVRNGVGKGNDIFNQATQSAVDLAAAMNNGVVDANGLKSANIQLGKALNDPVKGVTALSKVGVSFTAQQKEQIKSLVKSGDVLGAQKIILGEVGKEFGGAAAAAADPLTRLQTITGNLAEKVGGFLLPTVDKFANFMGDTLIPKAAAFSDVFAAKVTPKLQEFGGFINAEVLPRLKDFGGFLKDEVVPRVLEFGNFLTTKVVPAVAGFSTNLATSLAPAVRDVFGFFKTEVIPRLKDFGAFLGNDVLPKVGELATSLSKNKDFLIPFAATIVTIIAALKAWAIVQAVLNVVLSANPLGLIIIAIAALVAGVIWAFKNVGWFHDALVGAFQGIQAAAQFFAPLVKAAIDVVIGVFSLWWNYYAKPILKGFWEALKFAWGYAQTFGGVVVAAFNAIRGPAQAAISFVVSRFLDFVQTILDGAAKAFGWVPGLGPKLKTAAGEFSKFRDNVNAKLSGITDQTVTVTADLKSYGSPELLAAAHGRAGGGPGGPIDGPGTTTSDTAGLYALSRKEWVIKAKSSMQYGDYAMRSVNDGTATIIPNGGFAKGGRPGLDVDAGLPSNTGVVANAFASSIKNIGNTMAKSLAKNLIAAGINPSLNGVLSFVKSQVGKPYVWGGVGPGGYDCSGLVSAAINTAFGRNPHRRLGATGSMPWSSFASGPGAFEVGWFNGNPGHTAATVNGVNIESSGGRGVHMGPGARGARNSLFTNRAHVKGFAGGGPIGDAPYDSLHNKKQLMKELGIDLFDNGGRWKSGTLAANMSGKTETVVPGGDTMTVRLSDEDRRLLRDAGARPITLDGRRLDEQMSRRAMGGGF